MLQRRCWASSETAVCGFGLDVEFVAGALTPLSASAGLDSPLMYSTSSSLRNGGDLGRMGPWFLVCFGAARAWWSGKLPRLRARVRILSLSPNAGKTPVMARGQALAAGSWASGKNDNNGLILE